MREILTVLGILVCAALIAVMAGPHFVDWGQYRGVISRQISAATGLPTVIEGPVSLTLLPTPSISVEQVRIGDPDDNGFRPIEIERLAGSLAATGLLRGDFHITEALVDGLVLRFGPKGVESLKPRAGGGASIAPDAVSIERLVVRDGSAFVSRVGQAQRSITGINADLEATSILGPAKGNGSFVIDEATRNFRFALGRFENGRSRIKALVEDVRLALRFDVDGVFGFDEANEGEFEGSLALSGNPHLGDAAKANQIPVRVSSRARLRKSVVDLSEIALSAGADGQPFTLQGEGRLQIGQTPRYDLSLSARSFDFDRPGPDGKTKTLVPLDALKQLAALAPDGQGSVPEGRLEMMVGGIIVGGQTIIGANGVVETTASGPRLLAFEGEFPGQTRVKFARDPGASDGLLAGHIDIESRDPERLNGWLVGAPNNVTSAVSLKAGMDTASIPGGVNLRKIALSRGETLLTGEGSLLFAQAGLRPAPQISLKLSTPRLSISDIPTIISGHERKEDQKEIDFDLDLQAARLVYEGRETGRLLARLRRDGPIVTLERVALTDFDGANLIASGTIGGGSRQITVKLEAERLDGLGALGEKLLPGWLGDSLRRRARVIAPALLVVSLSDDDKEGHTSISAEGKLAGTAVKAAGKLAGRTDLTLELDVSLDNPNGSALARQISGAASNATASGPASVILKVRGNPRASLATNISGRIAGLDARIDGSIKIFQPFVPFEGTIDAKSPDLSLALAALGVELPASPPGQAGTLQGRVESNLERIAITNFKAEVAGAPISGEIAFNIAESGKVSGQIRLPYMDMRSAMAVAFGAGRITGGAGVWSDERFGKSLAPALSGDLWIEAEKARLDDSIQFEPARFVLRFDKDAASIEYSDLRLANAQIGGDLFMRRNGVTGYVSGKLRFGNVLLDRLGNGAARGQADGEFQLSGSGESPAQVMASLVGNGVLNLRNPFIAKFEQAALGRLLAVPPQAIGPLDSANITRRLEGELDKGNWNAPPSTLPLVFLNGVGRIANVSLDHPEVKSDLSGTIDLSSLNLDIRLTSTAKLAPLDWRGAQPQFATIWRGPILAPRRSLAVDTLVNGYLAYALHRNLLESEIIEQDIRERGFFNRRLKASEATRRQEEAQRKQDEAQRKLDDEARVVEQARLQEELKTAEDEDRRRRILQIIQQDDTPSTASPMRTPRPAAASVAPRRAAPAVVLPPPMDLTPSGPVRPLAAPPVEIRPLEAPAR